MLQKPLSIIGLDPGTTSAYAVLGLQGNVLKIFSAKEFPFSQIISQIIEVSLPLIVSTDKEKVPSLVQDFAAKFGAMVFVPEEDLKQEEKRKLIKNQSKEIQNDHQADALAAALFAYKKFKPTLNKIDGFIRKNDLEKLRISFTQLILKENLSFEIAKKILVSAQEGKEESKTVKIISEDKETTKKDFLRLFEKLNEIKKEKAFLENKNGLLSRTTNNLKKNNLSLDKKLNQTNQKIDNLLKFKEKRIKDLSYELIKKNGENESLLGEIRELKQLFLNLRDRIIVKKVKDLGQNFWKKDFELKEGDYLFVENPDIISAEVLEEVKKKGVKIFSKIKKKGFFVLGGFVDKGDFILVEKEQPEKAMEQRDILGEVMEEFKRNKK